MVKMCSSALFLSLPVAVHSKKEQFLPFYLSCLLSHLRAASAFKKKKEKHLNFIVPDSDILKN